MEASFFNCGPAINVDAAHRNTSTPAQLYAMGFRLLRLPCTPKEAVLAKSPFKTFINRCIAAGLRVIVDVHYFEQTDDNFIYQLPLTCLKVARSFQGYSASVLAIEFFNEPRFRYGIQGNTTERGPKEWTAIELLCIEAIRSVTPISGGKRWIVTSPPGLSGIDYFTNLYDYFPPIDRRTGEVYERLCVTLHYYNPFGLTHPQHYLQGTASNNPYPHPYPPSHTQNALYPLNPPFPNNSDGNFAIADWGNHEVHIQTYSDWCSDNSVYRFCGEYGCLKTVPGHVDYKIELIRVFSAWGVPHALWGLADGFGTGLVTNGTVWEFPTLQTAVLGIGNLE